MSTTSAPADRPTRQFIVVRIDGLHARHEEYGTFELDLDVMCKDVEFVNKVIAHRTSVVVK